jgi:hypothetical protein
MTTAATRDSLLVGEVSEIPPSADRTGAEVFHAARLALDLKSE